MIYIVLSLVVFFVLEQSNQISNSQNNLFYRDKKNNFLSKLIICVMLIILILFGGLRDFNIGFDLQNYKKNYDLILKGGISSGYSFEPLFQIITYLNTVIFKNDIGFTFSLIEYSCIMVISMYFVSKKLSSDLAISMFLFVSLGFYLKGFDQIRQTLALSLFMIGVVYANEKKYGLFFLFWVLSIGFHKTALILLPIYFLCKFKLKSFIYPLLIICVCIISAFKDYILKVVSKLLNYPYYDIYINSDLFVEKITLFGYLRLSLILFAFVTCLFCRDYFFKKEDNKKYNILLNMLFCSFAFCLMGVLTNMPLLFGRMMFYFVWPLYILIPEIIKKLRYKKIFRLMVLILGICYLFGATVYRNAYGVRNYQMVILKGK